MEPTIETDQQIGASHRTRILVFVLLSVFYVVASSSATLDMHPKHWNAVNDGVMGGVSAGEIVFSGDTLRFQGVLSFENNGGFASVRRPIDHTPDNINGVRLRIKGDGRRYQFRLRTNDQSDRVSWRHEFDTDGSQQVVELMLKDFEAVFRGRKVIQNEPLRGVNIRQLGLLLADGKPGKFQLNIEAIEFTTR